MYASPALQRPFASLAGAAALIAMLAVSGPAYAGKETSLTLRIGLAISETLAPVTDGICHGFEGHIQGVGYSTELGAVSVQATDCFVQTDSSGQNFAFASKPGTVVTLTTSSGDTLIGTTQGTATGQPFPIEAISGRVTFTGGTGRYKNAAGSGSIEGIENIGTTPATGILVISGTITY